MDYSIYTLSDPRDNEVRYVGISKNPCLRYGMHLVSSNTHLTTNEPKNEWIRELTAQDLMPVLTIVEKAEDEASAMKREQYWISCHLKKGTILLNRTGGSPLGQYKHFDPIKSPRLNIREMRIQRNWKQSELSRRSKVSLGTISQIEYAGHIPSQKVLNDLASALEVTVEQLFL